MSKIAQFLCPILVGLMFTWVCCLLLPVGLARIVPLCGDPLLRSTVLAIALTVEICGKLSFVCFCGFAYWERRSVRRLIGMKQGDFGFEAGTLPPQPPPSMSTAA